MSPAVNFWYLYAVACPFRTLGKTKCQKPYRDHGLEYNGIRPHDRRRVYHPYHPYRAHRLHRLKFSCIFNFRSKIVSRGTETSRDDDAKLSQQRIDEYQKNNSTVFLLILPYSERLFISNTSDVVKFFLSNAETISPDFSTLDRFFTAPFFYWKTRLNLLHDETCVVNDWDCSLMKFGAWQGRLGTINQVD